MKVIFSKQPRRPRLQNRSVLLAALRRALELSGLPARMPRDADATVSVVLVSAASMTELNARYLGRPEPTDVLAFDLTGSETASVGPVVAGEIYVCLDVAEQAARDYSTSVGYEVLLYIIHGMLHLVGFDDDSSAARHDMRQAEKAILGQLQEKWPLCDLFGPGDGDMRQRHTKV